MAGVRDPCAAANARFLSCNGESERRSRETLICGRFDPTPLSRRRPTFPRPLSVRPPDKRGFATLRTVKSPDWLEKGDRAVGTRAPDEPSSSDQRTPPPPVSPGGTHLLPSEAAPHWKQSESAPRRPEPSSPLRTSPDFLRNHPSPFPMAVRPTRNGRPSLLRIPCPEVSLGIRDFLPAGRPTHGPGLASHQPFRSPPGPVVRVCWEENQPACQPCQSPRIAPERRFAQRTPKIL